MLEYILNFRGDKMRSKKKAFYKRRTVLVASALCAVAALGLAGIYKMETAKTRQEQELVNWEETERDVIRAGRGDDMQPEAKQDKKASLVEREEEKQNEPEQQEVVESAQPQEAALPDMAGTVDETIVSSEPTTSQTDDQAAQASVQNAINLNFQPENGMKWPVEGNVVLDYSMNQTIYFPTLDQYKYNPAIAIQSECGTPVIAAAAGVIESIEQKSETGLTMTIDIGNGYQLVYGQLADVALSTGSYVEAGSRIATIAEPSIYYQVEGDNLYFQVLKDGTSVDPLDYLK